MAAKHIAYLLLQVYLWELLYKAERGGECMLQGDIGKTVHRWVIWISFWLYTVSKIRLY